MPADWCYYLSAAALLAANAVAWLGGFYRLPGNWVIVGNVALYAQFFPNKPNGLGVGWGTVALILVLAAVGESVGYVARHRRKLAADRQSLSWESTVIAAGVGGGLGALLGLAVPIMGPFLSTIGSIGGAAAGASLGTFLSGPAAVPKQAPPDTIRRREQVYAAVETGTRLSFGLLLVLIAASAALAD